MFFCSLFLKNTHPYNFLTTYLKKLSDWGGYVGLMKYEQILLNLFQGGPSKNYDIIEMPLP